MSRDDLLADGDVFFKDLIALLVNRYFRRGRSWVYCKDPVHGYFIPPEIMHARAMLRNFDSGGSDLETRTMGTIAPRTSPAI